MLTPDLVCRAGHALFGEEWQSPLARMLDVNDRTIRRIAKAAREGADYTVNAAWAVELRTALERTAKDRELEARAAKEVAQLLAGIGA